jgi:hypothetical protein
MLEGGSKIKLRPVGRARVRAGLMAAKLTASGAVAKRFLARSGGR